MSYIVIVTKPSHALDALPALKKRYPGRRIVGVLDGVISLLTFRYPRGLTMANYPFVAEPQWRPNVRQIERMSVVYEITAGHRVSLEVDPFEAVRGAERIICADGDGYGGAANFDMLMRDSGGDALADRPHDFLRYFGGGLGHLQRAVEDMGTTHDADFIALRDGGLMKRRFDWCFATNSQALLGAAYRHATGAAASPPIGKYGLQLLYAMRESEPMTENEIMRLLHCWPGTGRYAKPDRRTTMMGSAASKAQIMEDVTDLPLVAAVTTERNNIPRTVYSLSETGHRFLDALHPDCQDPDLPFRIGLWQEQGLASQGAVDRYIRTFFGKQKRFMGTWS